MGQFWAARNGATSSFQMAIIYQIIVPDIFLFHLYFYCYISIAENLHTCIVLGGNSKMLHITEIKQHSAAQLYRKSTILLTIVNHNTNPMSPKSSDQVFKHFQLFLIFNKFTVIPCTKYYSQKSDLYKSLLLIQ